MRPEQIFASLELLVDRLPFDLPCHEDGGYVYPFIWDGKVQAEFNIFNLCRSNNWIKLTDAALVIKQWEGLAYAQAFNDFSLNDEEIEAWQNGIESLAQSVNCLNNLQAYDFQFRSDVFPNSIMLGQDHDGNWIGITSTVYVASNIPQATLDFTPNTRLSLDIATDRSDIFDRITSNISILQRIEMSGDFGGGYIYSYTHQMVYGIGATRELAWESTLQASGMLARGKLNTIYQRDNDLLDRYCDDGEERINDVFGRYKNIVKLLKQELSEPIVYRISSWNSENIYIAGEIKNHVQGDLVGIYIKSNFVYNP
jgi:Nuclease A inhibitor-like protein